MKGRPGGLRIVLRLSYDGHLQQNVMWQVISILILDREEAIQGAIRKHLTIESFVA